VTVIDGTGIDRVFDIVGQAILSGVTIEHGDSDTSPGAGIRSTVNLTLTDLVVTQNVGAGGAIDLCTRGGCATCPGSMADTGTLTLANGLCNGQHLFEWATRERDGAHIGKRDTHQRRVRGIHF